MPPSLYCTKCLVLKDDATKDESSRGLLSKPLKCQVGMEVRRQYWYANTCQNSEQDRPSPPRSARQG